MREYGIARRHEKGLPASAMFVVRQATSDDRAPLTKFAEMLPVSGWAAGRAEIARRIELSSDSFAGRVSDDLHRQFLFVLEDTDRGAAIGAGALLSCVSGPGQPLVWLSIRRHRCFSSDLQGGQEQVTLQFQADNTPVSEVADLILAPPYRGHREKLASLLGLVRFHFIGLRRDWFADSVIAHLPPPASPDRSHPFWEHLGGRFVNLAFDEAQELRRHSTEFLTALFPKTEIHVSLLPPHVRRLIGRVAEEAVPAKVLLKRIGFALTPNIDPVHGGAILRAATDQIPLVAATRATRVGDPAESYPLSGLVSAGAEGQFRAVRSPFAERNSGICIPAETAGLLGIHVGDAVAVTCF